MSFSDVLKGKFEVNSKPEDITEKLNAIRKVISRTYFDKLRSGQQANFIDFLFDKMDKVWLLHPDLHQLISETVGCILMSLGPFHGQMLMEALHKVFASSKAVSVLMIACFCYLANFLVEEELKPISELLKKTPLADPGSPELVKLLKRQLKAIPADYLPDLAKSFLKLYMEDRSLATCAKAVRVIVAYSADVWLQAIDPSLPLSVLGDCFAKGLPSVPPEMADKLRQRCVNEIKNTQSDPKEFAGACVFLRALILTKQAPIDCVHGIYDDKTISSAPDPRAILLVPIELEIVMKIYGSRNWEDHRIEMESAGMMVDYPRVSGEDDAVLTSQFDSTTMHSVFVPRTSAADNMEFALPLPEKVESSDPSDQSGQAASPQEPAFVPTSFDDDMNLELGSPIVTRSADSKSDGPASGPLPAVNDGRRRSMIPPLPDTLLHSTGFSSPRPKALPLRTRSATVREMQAPNQTTPPTIPLPLSRDSSLSIPAFNIGPQPKPQPLSAKRQPSGLLTDYAEYMSSNAAIDYRLLDDSFMVVLMKYFCFFPNYEHELGSLILYGITSHDALFDDAIRITAKALNIFGSETLNCILFHAFKATNPPPARRIRLLKLVKSISFNRLIKVVGDKIMTFLDNSLGQKLARMHKITRDAAIGLYFNTSSRIFKFAFDAMVAKLDVFDEFLFEQRLAFLAGVLKHVPPTFALYFRHLHTLLSEILALTPFSKRALTDMFRIESLLARACDVSELSLFIQYAVNVLEVSYKTYTGSGWGLKLPAMFTLQLPKYEFQTGTYTDIIGCPTHWHTKIVPCGEAAYQFLTAVPWADLKLKNAEATWLIALAMKCVQIFPAESNNLVRTLLESYPSFVKGECVKYLNMSIKYSITKEHIVSLCGLWIAAMENNISSKVDIERTRKQLLACVSTYGDLHYKQVATLRDCMLRLNIKCTDEVFENMVCKAEKENWLNQDPPDRLELDLNVGIPPPSIADERGPGEEEQGAEEEDATDLVGIHDNDPLEEKSLEGFAAYLTSITPLLYANLDVPARLLPSVVIISFTQYSKAQISERQCMDLFNLALEFPSSRTVFYVLRYAQQCKLNIDIKPYLQHKIIRCKQMFQLVLTTITAGKNSLADLAEEELDYIKFFASEDLFDFVLNANGPQRKTGAFLVKFDPEFFLCRYKMLNELSLQQLTTLGSYLSVIPPSSNNAALTLLTGLLGTTSENLHIKLVKRRLMSMYLVSHPIPAGYIKQNWANVFLFHLDRDGNLPVKEISLLPCVEIIEIHYAIQVVGYKLKEYSYLLGQLVPLLGKTSSFGSSELILSGRATEEELVWFLKLEQLPSIDLHVMDALTRDMKAKAENTPPISVLSMLFNKNWVWTATLREQAYGFFYIASTKELSHELKRTLFKVCVNTAFSDSGQCVRLAVLMKRFQAMFPNKGDEVKSIIQICGDTIAEGRYPRVIIEVMTTICQKVRNWTLLKEVFSKALLTTAGPNAVMMADSLTLANFMTCSDQSEAASIIPKAKYFFAIFNALVTIEKKNREMVHTKFMEQYHGCHRRALEYLTNPKLRIFSPWLAYASSDFPVPENVSTFLDFIADKIQRVHEVDTCHEW